MGNSPKPKVEINFNDKLKIDCQFLSHLTNSAIFISKTGYALDFKYNEVSSMFKSFKHLVNKIKIAFKKTSMIKVTIVR